MMDFEIQEQVAKTGAYRTYVSQLSLRAQLRLGSEGFASIESQHEKMLQIQ